MHIKLIYVKVDALSTNIIILYYFQHWTHLKRKTLREKLSKNYTQQHSLKSHH